MSTDENGNEVAILLLDTQGTFDRQTSTAVNSFIFGFSIAVSSVMIYNLMCDISEQSLDNLLVFGESFRELFGPFQEAKFLIRDWNDEERFEFGADGGRRMVDSIFGLEEFESTDANAQLAQTRTQIKNLFGTLSCFLLPSPGEKLVKEKKNPITVDHLNDDFKEYINELCHELFIDKLTIRKTNDFQWTSETFLSGFDEMADAHANGKTCDPGTFREAMFKRRADEATQLFIESYVTNMEIAILDELDRNAPVPYIEETFLVLTHIEVRTILLEEFDRRVVAFNRCPPEVQTRLKGFLNTWLKEKRVSNAKIRASEEKRFAEQRRFEKSLRVREAMIENVKLVARESESRMEEMRREMEQYKRDITEKHRQEALAAIQEVAEARERFMKKTRLDWEKNLAEVRRERMPHQCCIS